MITHISIVSKSIEYESYYMMLFKFRVVLCRIRLFPTLISKMKWLWSGLPLNYRTSSVRRWSMNVLTVYEHKLVLYFSRVLLDSVQMTRCIMTSRLYCILTCQYLTFWYHLLQKQIHQLASRFSQDSRAQDILNFILRENILNINRLVPFLFMGYNWAKTT